jgi:hypothetical protein
LLVEFTAQCDSEVVPRIDQKYIARFNDVLSKFRAIDAWFDRGGHEAPPETSPEHSSEPGSASPRGTPSADQSSPGESPSGSGYEPEISGTGASNPPSRNTPQKKRKPPSKEAVMAYRLHLMTGMKQTVIAAKMSEELGRVIGQGQVSRWKDEAQRWIEGGGVLPPLPDAMTKPQAMDPNRLDLGPRRDGRVARQRPRRDEEVD